MPVPSQHSPSAPAAGGQSEAGQPAADGCGSAGRCAPGRTGRRRSLHGATQPPAAPPPRTANFDSYDVVTVADRSLQDLTSIPDALAQPLRCLAAPRSPPRPRMSAGGRRGRERDHTPAMSSKASASPPISSPPAMPDRRERLPSPSSPTIRSSWSASPATAARRPTPSRGASPSSPVRQRCGRCSAIGRRHGRRRWWGKWGDGIAVQ